MATHGISIPLPTRLAAALAAMLAAAACGGPQSAGVGSGAGPPREAMAPDSAAMVRRAEQALRQADPSVDAYRVLSYVREGEDRLIRLGPADDRRGGGGLVRVRKDGSTEIVTRYQ
jgi:hypothetical protein